MLLLLFVSISRVTDLSSGKGSPAAVKNFIASFDSCILCEWRRVLQHLLELERQRVFIRCCVAVFL